MEIVLEGPAKNALGTPLLTQLRDRLLEAGNEPVLLTGAGDAFSAGLNLKEVSGLQREGMAHFLGLLEEVIERLFLHPAPTVAAVNGHAIAGGALLAMACDHSIATTHPKARIGLNEVALGLVFPPKLLAFVRYTLPTSADEVVLGAGLHSPEQALRLGLVGEVTEDPLAAARARLEVLAAHPRATYGRAKQDLRGTVMATDEEGQRRFLDEIVPMWASDELRQRIAAFLNNR
ncbi:MAG: enoyl-CoA hydratase/isomerase family protein [Myxococcales bacterium]|nr:enoyl-CoA hydratase/isomerase family protein [Myxococcales bacterium]